MKSSTSYFDALGWQGLQRQPVELQQSLQGCNAVGSCKRLLPPRLVRRAFGGCTHQVLAFSHARTELRMQTPCTRACTPIYMLYTRQVLAFETLFSTIKLQSNWSYCHTQAGGRQCWPLQRFLSRVALPSLLTPQPWLQAAAARAAQRVVARAPAGARELGCLQVLAHL